jgi:S-(hydroxymethyl)mycothiol dehydrogenase
MTMTAQGVISRKSNAPAEVEEFVIEDLGPGEVLVKILASGVCHTDLFVKNGGVGEDGFPFLLGHEGAGIIEEVGPGVETPKKGDYVILAWRAPCGKCRFCLFGQPSLCAASLNAQPRMRGKDGKMLNPVLGIGTFCTHTVVHANQAIVVASDLPAPQMSLIGCGVMTGVGAALYTAAVRPGTSVAVIGCGGVGDSVIQGAKLAGATTIIAVDLDDRKLAWAKDFGATHTVNARNGDSVEQIKALTGGNGVNYSFECVGRPETLNTALWCRDLAGVCTIIGVASADMKIELPIQQYFSLGGSLRVSWYGDCLPSRDFPMLASLYRQGRFKLDELVTRLINLSETEEAFHAMERGETLRSVITFDA